MHQRFVYVFFQAIYDLLIVSFSSNLACKAVGLETQNMCGEDFTTLGCYCHPGMAITYIDELVVVSLPQVMEHRGIVKVCQVRHILSFFVFRRVHLLELIFLEVSCLFCSLRYSSFQFHIMSTRFVSYSFYYSRFGQTWLAVVFQRERREKIPQISQFLTIYTYVDKLSIITLAQIVQHARCVQHGHVGHIFNFFEFWWIYFLHLLGFKIFYLVEHKYKNLKFSLMEKVSKIPL